jgi:ParB family chromosome partitioning protein
MSGLGRGLDSLIPTGDENASNGLTEISVGLIDVNPHQPRTVFVQDDLDELAASIKKHGVLQPLVVSPAGDHYQLIAGERRLRASKLAGLAKVPVIVRDVSEHEKLELAIIENVHRSNLNPIDEAISYRKLVEEFSYTQDQVAEVMGKSRASVANKIRLLALPTDIKRALKDGKITEGHGKALLSIEDPKKQLIAFEQIISGDLNVREAEKNAQLHNSPTKKEKPEADLIMKQLAEDLKNHLGSKVDIKNSSRGGKIEISYYSQEELNRIYQRIKGVE